MRTYLAIPLLLFSSAAHAVSYTEGVTLSFRQDEVTYKAGISTAYLLLDDIHGMNPMCQARPMTPSGGGTWSVTVDLPEGDYIYVFVANADAYVNLADCGLNPDDVPDANFFNDPHPRDAGLAGQFGKDNVLYVRSPERPRFVVSSATPLPGSLTTAASIALSVKIQTGASRTPIDGASVRVRFEKTEAPALWGPVTTAQELVEITAHLDPADGAITAAVDDPPEGFHRIFVDASGTDGLAADTFTTSVIVNRSDQTPTADAGPTRFAAVGRAVQLDGSGSFDPDRIGIASWHWRVVSGPGSASFRYVDEERVVRDGFGLPVLTDDGLQIGVELASASGTPWFQPQAAGRYVVALSVSDPGGHTSTEDTTEVWVVSAFDASQRPKVVVTIDADRIHVDARTSAGAATTARWIEDANNPAPLGFAVDGRQVTFATPPAGVYFLHVQLGDSYPATAVVRVDASRHASGSDFAKPPRFWAEDANVYMVFPRTFQDSDGDGRGDFRGLIQKLPYLNSLGVNALWLMPVTPGPTSHGYAATAHFMLEEDYGTMADFDAFIAAAHDAGMKVVFDLVANHTSNRHPFFQAAEQNPQSPLRDLYVYDSDGSYQYAFDFSTLPSANYNSPLVRQLFLDVVDFWMDHGVDAIRADIAGFVPPSFWRAVRRQVRGRSDDAILLAEIIPPSPGFFDGEQFDVAYDAYLFWNFKDLFATSGGLDGFDAALDAAERFITDASVKLAREKQDPENVIRMRYLDTQDEDRFLLKAGRSINRQRAAAGALLTLPGMPMIFYGDETGAVQMRGPMTFDANPDLLSQYRRLLNVRNAHAGLRGQDSGALGDSGDSFVRINGDRDPGGNAVFSFARYREGERFIVLVDRFDASVVGTQVEYWPPPAILADYPETIYLQNQLDPTDILLADKASLRAGFTSAVGAYETKIYLLLEHPVPDSDQDLVADSWDNCIADGNPLQEDKDRDGVGDACDACEEGGLVGLDGCPAASGAPRVRYQVHDGVVDDDAYRVADELWASFNGRELYVATRAALPGKDRFVLVASTTESTSAAPFEKSGTVAGAPRVLADEGDNDYAGWLRVTAQARAGAAVLALAEAGNGVLEGTLNLQDQFGDTLPEKIFLSAVEYDSSGGLLAQSPPSTDDSADVGASEYLEFSIFDPTPTDPEGPSDFDGDGFTDSQDNCPGVSNEDQRDFDGDDVGDLCDDCPASAKGQAIDGSGCPIDPGHPQKPHDDEQSLGCAVGAPGDSASGLWFVIFGFAWRRRRCA